jgi:hypothetical protein
VAVTPTRVEKRLRAGTEGAGVVDIPLDPLAVVAAVVVACPPKMSAGKERSLLASKPLRLKPSSADFIARSQNASELPNFVALNPGIGEISKQRVAGRKLLAWPRLPGSVQSMRQCETKCKA